MTPDLLDSIRRQAREKTTEVADQGGKVPHAAGLLRRAFEKRVCPQSRALSLRQVQCSDEAPTDVHAGRRSTVVFYLGQIGAAEERTARQFRLRDSSGGAKREQFPTEGRFGIVGVAGAGLLHRGNGFDTTAFCAGTPADHAVI